MYLDPDTHNSYWMFCLFVYGSLPIIIPIIMIRTVNSVSSSMGTCTWQYGARSSVRFVRNPPLDGSITALCLWPPAR